MWQFSQVIWVSYNLKLASSNSLCKLFLLNYLMLSNCLVLPIKTQQTLSQNHVLVFRPYVQVQRNPKNLIIKGWLRNLVFMFNKTSQNIFAPIHPKGWGCILIIEHWSGCLLFPFFWDNLGVSNYNQPLRIDKMDMWLKRGRELRYVFTLMPI